MIDRIITMLSTLDEQQLVFVLSFLQGLTGGGRDGNQGK